MPDPIFFGEAKSLSLEEIASISGAELKRGDPSISPKAVAALAEAENTDISFFDNIKYKDEFIISKAGACFITEDMVEIAPKDMALLVSNTPYKSYAITAQNLYPEIRPEENISSSALIDNHAKIGSGCIIESGAVIQAGAKIGDNVWIDSCAVIGRNVSIGNGTKVGANATITHSLIGENVTIYPGCRIGQDGFGFAIDVAGHVKVPQLGRVIIEDSVEIGANTCIDRGAGPDTIIGQGTWIDNLVQIGHNVKIGRGCVIVSQVGISGSTVLEDFVVLAGQVGVAGHLNIGKGARLAARSGVMRDVPPGVDYMGAPAVPKRQYMKQLALLNKLTNGKKDK
jgi:UDP-3-O-[3-hydroxymyristoyl] glucosamine N-acyltransferase